MYWKFDPFKGALYLTGDMDGPASSVDNTLVRFDGTTGKRAQGSGIVVSDTNNMSGIGTIASGAHTMSGAGADISCVITSGSDSSFAGLYFTQPSRTAILGLASGPSTFFSSGEVAGDFAIRGASGKGINIGLGATKYAGMDSTGAWTFTSAAFSGTVTFASTISAGKATFTSTSRNQLSLATATAGVGVAISFGMEAGTGSGGLIGFAGSGADIGSGNTAGDLIIRNDTAGKAIKIASGATTVASFSSVGALSLLAGLSVAGISTFTGAINIPSTSYFIGNATNGFRFNNAADTDNLLTISNLGAVVIGATTGSGLDHIMQSNGSTSLSIVPASGSNSSVNFRSSSGANKWTLVHNAGASNAFEIYGGAAAGSLYGSIASTTGAWDLGPANFAGTHNFNAAVIIQNSTSDPQYTFAKSGSNKAAMYWQSDEFNFYGYGLLGVAGKFSTTTGGWTIGAAAGGAGSAHTMQAGTSDTLTLKSTAAGTRANLLFKVLTVDKAYIGVPQNAGELCADAVADDFVFRNNTASRGFWWTTTDGAKTANLTSAGAFDLQSGISTGGLGSSHRLKWKLLLTSTVANGLTASVAHGLTSTTFRSITGVYGSGSGVGGIIGDLGNIISYDGTNISVLNNTGSSAAFDIIVYYV
jgi:hypothetical protein